MGRAYVGIGSNLGNRQQYVETARREMARLPGTELVAFSTVIETDPVGPVPQGKFLNAAAGLETTLSPRALLEALAAIEAGTGRQPRQHRPPWGPRTLDLDILLYDERVISDDRLVIPHPLMHERRFVLQPLAEIAPEAVHPVLEMTVAELLKDLDRIKHGKHAAHQRDFPFHSG
jgi:2-amino-4-hydroxy-6-hydroxymethyldihydropteridine diphosphokinase